MKSSNLVRIILPVVVVMIVVYGLRVGIQMLLQAHDTATIRTIDEAIKSQRAFVMTTADLTRQNTADSVTQKIILDCSTADRQRFDALLDSLSKNISAGELNDLTILFYKCGYFDAERKNIMAARLTEAITTLKNLKDVRNQIEPLAEASKTEITTWTNISEAEQKWAQFSTDLVTEQGLIIDLLHTGKTTASPEVVAVITKANNARSQMVVLGNQIQNYRQSIQSI